MDELNTYMSSDAASDWETAYWQLVDTGKASVDEWLLAFLWHRIQWPSEEYSIFRNSEMIKTTLFQMQIVFEADFNEKIRFVRVFLFAGHPEIPEFENIQKVSDEEWRFPSIGNPVIDKENYRWWEKYLFCKLCAQVLLEQKVLDSIIEIFRRHL